MSTPKSKIVLPKVTMIMLESLNGVIAQSDDDRLQWGGKEDKAHFKRLTQEIGTVIMGSASFDALNRKPLPGRHNLVVTSNPDRYSELEPTDSLEFHSGSPQEILADLAKRGKEWVALIGGGRLNQAFLSADLVDEITITIAPVLFTGGTKLLGPDLNPPMKVGLSLSRMHNLDQNTLLLNYKVT